MAAVWGEAEVQVHVDGTSLPREVTEITTEAGNIGGKNFNKTFGQRIKTGLKDTFDKIKGFFSGIWAKLFRRGGKTLGDEFSKGVSNSLDKVKFGDGFLDSARDSMKSFRLEFDEMTTDLARRSTDIDFGHWADDFGNLRRVFPEITQGFEQLAIAGNKNLDIWEPLTEDIGELHVVMDRASNSSREMGGSFSTLRQRAIGMGEAFGGYNDRVRGHNGLLARMRNQYDKLKIAWGDGGGFRGMLGKLSDAFDKNTKAGNRNGSMWKRLSANTRQWTLIIAAVIGAFGDLAVLGAAAGAGIFVLGSAIGSLAVGGIAAIAIFKALNQDIKDAPDGMKPLIKEFDNFKKSIKGVGDEIAMAAFGEMSGAFDSLSKTVKGLSGPLQKVGKTIGRLVADLAKNLAPGTDAFKDLSQFIDDSAGIVDTLGRSFGKLFASVIKGFNRANPLTKSFVGWIDKLVDRFGAFVNGPGFDEWIGHAESVFGPFGALLDTVGRLLNDMVTDETVGQLVDFIEHIDSFLKGPGKDILDFAQKLDVFGLLAEALDVLGTALEPLGGPLIELADAFNGLISSSIASLAPIITDIAEALVPFVEAITDFIKQNPEAAAQGLAAIAAGFVAIKAVGILANVVTPIKGFIDLVGGKNVTKMAKFAAGLAGIGVALAGAFTTANADKSNGIAASGGILGSVLGGAASGAIFAGPIGALVGAVGGLLVNAITSMFSETDNVWKNGWSQLFDPSDTSGAGIGQIKANIAMVIPEFQKGFETMAVAITGFFTGIGDAFATGWEQITGFFTGAFTSITEGWSTFWANLGDPAWWDSIATALGEWIASLIDGFTNWLSGIFDLWDNFWATMNDPEFWNAIWDGIKEWWQGILDGFTTWWSDVTEGWGTFWATLNDPALWGAVGSAIATWWASVLSGFQNWWSNIVTGWNNFWGGLPKSASSAGGDILSGLQGWWASVTAGFRSWWSDITTGWNNFWGGLAGAVSSAVGRITDLVNRIAAPIRDALGNLGKLISGRASATGGAASGRMVAGPQRILVGEDGPEAIVPLRRSLSRVNPEVRALSAIAQGKADGLPSDSVPRGGRVLNVAPGAIVIQGVRDPNAAALGVVNRLAERIAG